MRKLLTGITKVSFGLVLVTSVTVWAHDGESHEKMTHKAGDHKGATNDAFVDSYLKMSESLASDKKLSEFDLIDFQTKAKAAKLPKEAMASVQKLISAKDIKKQRKAFKKVSAAAVTYAESKKLKVFKANCPMAKADWLQSKAEVRNPYYGASMLSCGSSKEL